MRLTRRGAVLLAGVPLLAGCGVRSLAMSAPPGTATIQNAIYSWWTHPLAVNTGGYTWVGGVARRGTVRVARVHGVSGEVRMVEISRRHVPDRPDDHNAPALVLEPGGRRLLVFSAGHGYDNVLRFRALDPATLAVSPERELSFSAGITYAQVLRVGDRLVVFTRVGSSTWRYRASDDFGVTWSRERTFFDADGFGQVYLVAKPVAEDEYLLACYGHPVSSRLREVSSARLRLGRGSVERVDGTVIGNLYRADGPGFRPGDLPPAIRPAAGHRVRLLDVGTIDGRPAIGYAVWQGETGLARYELVRYLGRGWSRPPWQLGSGDPFGHDPATHYLGGMAFGPGDRLYAARKDGVWYLEQWRWSERAETFRLERELHRADAPLVRPYVPAGTGPAEAIVQRLYRYRSFTDFDADTLVF